MRRMATMILLSAIPGSGKSTWAREYQNAHPNTYIVASDEVRKRVSGSTQNFDHEALVWETFLNDINEHAGEDCTVIADATNLQNRFRRYYYETTPGFDKHILVVFDIPFEVCMKQNLMRAKERIVPEAGMIALHKEFEPPIQEVIDLYDEYYYIGADYKTVRVK